MSQLPNDSTHLSDQSREEMIEQYGGQVESQFAKASIMRAYADVRPVRGTDTLIDRRVGRTTLQSLTPGVRPPATPTAFGRVSVTVDTVILARDNRSMLNEFQTDFNARMEIGEDHGKEIGKFFDQAFLIQAVKGSRADAPAGLNGAIGAGKQVALDATGDENDPDKLDMAIRQIVVDMEEEEIDASELVVMMSPTRHNVLLNHDKLVSGDYSDGNGNFAKGTLFGLAGARAVKTARIPRAAISDHKLGAAYNVSAVEAKAVAVVLHPKSLLAGETIPLTSDVWFNREEKQWFIDSFLSFGVTVKRPDVCGAVFAN